MLTTILSYRCRYCHASISRSDVNHEDGCVHRPQTQHFHHTDKQQHGRNPNVHWEDKSSFRLPSIGQSVCHYCGTRFSDTYEGSSTSQCHRHELLCKSNPDCYSRCQYCGLRFQSTVRAPSKSQCFIHQSNCQLNPQNQCRYCGLKLSGWGTLQAAQESRQKHEMVCSRNIANRASCPYCGLTFQNLTSGLLCSEQVRNHEKDCKSNRHNRCSYCGIAFPGQAYLIRHFNRCPQKQEADVAYQRASFYGHSYYNQPHHPPPEYYVNNDLFYDWDMLHGNGAHHASVPFEFVEFGAQYMPMHANTCAPQQSEDWIGRRIVDSAIADLELQLQECGDDQQRIRSQLKRLLLVWHPDKTKKREAGRVYDDRVVNEVFRYVNERWKEFNANRGG